MTVYILFRTKQNKALEQAQVQLQQLQVRHDTLLELMGEKEEQVEELKADLLDVKQLYRSQIDMLVARLEAAERKQQK